MGPFPVASEKSKVLIVAIDYFIKWVEAEAVSQITMERVCQFYWRNIICHFGLPEAIVSNNDTQFSSFSVVEFFKDLGIQNQYISVEHPEENGQAKVRNMIIYLG